MKAPDRRVYRPRRKRLSHNIDLPSRHEVVACMLQPATAATLVVDAGRAHAVRRWRKDPRCSHAPVNHVALHQLARQGAGRENRSVSDAIAKMPQAFDDDLHAIPPPLASR